MKKTKFCAFALATALLCPFGVGAIPTSAETWATNFKGIITETEQDGFVYYNYYINKNHWVFGDGVELARYNSAKERDYCRFLDCNNRSLFGPRVRYEDFVCRFTVIIDNIDLGGVGESLGLSFNRKTLYSYANDCDGVMFMRAEAGTAVRVTQGNMDKASTGTIWLQYQDENAIDIWAESGGKFDFMVVKAGDEAQLYYGKAGDAEAMKILRATISGVSGEGFVAMSGIMGANFHLDNFGVWDLSETCGDFSGYTFTGSAAQSGDKAVLGHGGSLCSTQSYADVAFTYDVKVTGGKSFVCTVGDEFINFAADGSITGSSGLTVEKSGVVDFAAFAKGACVRLRKMGAKLYVDVNYGTGYMTKAVFAMGDAEQKKFGIAAGADASLIINGVAAASLEKTVEIATKDYDPNVDVDLMGPKDVSFKDYYKGVK